MNPLHPIARVTSLVRCRPQIYANSEETFFTDFAAAFQKLTERGFKC